jgi:hypothetical protein
MPGCSAVPPGGGRFLTMNRDDPYWKPEMAGSIRPSGGHMAAVVGEMFKGMPRR